MHELRLAFRALRATPVASGVALLSLALGLGANTAIFSLVNSLLLRSLPVRAPERLASISTAGAPSDQQFSYRIYDELRRQGQPFDGVLAWAGLDQSTMTAATERTTVDSQFVSGEFFQTLGVRPAIGRVFTPADDVSGGGPEGAVAVISYGLWQQRFGGASSVIGTRVIIERAPVTIVGVTPKEFFGVEVGRAFQVALPIRTQPIIYPAGTIDDDGAWLRMMVRMKPGQSIDAATAALRALQPAIRTAAMPRQVRPSFLKDLFVLAPAGAGMSALRQRFERPLLTLLVVAALVLVVACANIANLQLARGVARQAELSVRLALGASSWRLVRQVMIEALVLAAAGTALGLALAAWASRALVAQLSTSARHVVLDFATDWRLLTFSMIAMIATAVAFGVAPAIRATRVDAAATLKADGRTVAGDSHVHLANGLVVAQVALSFILLVSAALFVRTFQRLASAPLGFDRDQVLVVTVNAAQATVPDEARNAFYDRLVEAVRGVPGVTRAGGSVATPFAGPRNTRMFVRVAGNEFPAEFERSTEYNVVTPGWFSAYGILSKAGRDIDGHDTLASQQVLVVNETFVRRFLSGRAAIGSVIMLSIDPDGAVPVGSRTIIGIVGDAASRSLRVPTRPTAYLPLGQLQSMHPLVPFYISVHSVGLEPERLAQSVDRTLSAMDGHLGLKFRSLADQVNESIIEERLVAVLAAFFGGLALLLAGLGLYGVTAYAVSRRYKEMGVRIALGARPTMLVRSIVIRTLGLVALGLLVGGSVALWTSRFIVTLLYGLEPHDPATLLSAAVCLAAVGAVAAWIPAQSAATVDPLTALRQG